MLCVSSPLSPALLPETLIQTPSGFVEIQHLRSDDTVSGIDLKFQKKIISKIREVRKYLVASRMKITTNLTAFTVSCDQLMRVERAPPERAQILDSDPEDCFVAAQNLRVGDQLQTLDNGIQTITKIEHIGPAQASKKDIDLFHPPAHSFAECAIFYGLHLDEPHHFYATEQNILMHNFAIAAPLAGELASMVCALGIGAAGSYLSPSNSGFNTPAFPASFNPPDSSINTFTPFRFDQLGPPASDTQTFGHANRLSSTHFNDLRMLSAISTISKIPELPAGVFAQIMPGFNWTFDGLIGFDGNLLCCAIAHDVQTDTYCRAGIFRGRRNDPELQHIVRPHDAMIHSDLMHIFNDLNNAQHELLASQTGCYDDSAENVQAALAAVDVIYAKCRFASTVAYVCLQENISLSAIMHTINHGKKCSSAYWVSPHYKVYESAENNLRILTYEKPFSTILVLGVSAFDGFVQVPTDRSLSEKYRIWREEKLKDREHYKATRKKPALDNLPLPENVPMNCGTGQIKDFQFQEPQPAIVTTLNPPEVACGGSALPPHPENNCGTSSRKEPKPKETCNWSQEQKCPPFGESDEVGHKEDQTEQPTDSDAPSIEKPADESIPETKSIDELVTEEVTEAALRPTDLERIDGDPKKQKHVIEGSKGHDHQLELVAPDKTWEQVRAIIEEVMKTGKQGKDEGKRRCKFKYIKGHPVVVTYGEHNGVDKIGVVMIPLEENLNRYISPKGLK
jgi:hypothetical protein